MAVLLGERENKESSLCYAFIHPALGTGRPGTASSTPGQPSSAIPAAAALQGSGCSERWGQRAAPALRVSAGIWVGSCLLGAPHDIRMREPDVFCIPSLSLPRIMPGPHLDGAKGVLEPRTGEQGSLAPGLVGKGCFAPHTE